MACTKNLFDILGGTPLTGGTWVFDPTGNPVGDPSITGDWAGAGSANGSATYAPTNPIPGDETLTFTPNASTVDGTYEFQYSATGGCTTPAIATLTIVAGVVVGTDVTVSYCDNDNTDYNLLSLTSIGAGSTGGRWTGNGYGVLGHNDGGTTTDATDDTFNPDTAAVGDYEYIYTVDAGADPTYGQDSCEDCVGTMTLTIQVTALADSGTDGSFTICNEFTAT